VIPDAQLARGLDILEEELLARAAAAGRESRLSLSPT
jgi:hypothetical protein